MYTWNEKGADILRAKRETHLLVSPQPSASTSTTTLGYIPRPAPLAKESTQELITDPLGILTRHAATLPQLTLPGVVPRPTRWQRRRCRHVADVPQELSPAGADSACVRHRRYLCRSRCLSYPPNEIKFG